MAKLPDWIEIKNKKVINNKLDWCSSVEIKLKYIPKFIDWELWIYPIIIGNSLYPQIYNVPI